MKKYKRVLSIAGFDGSGGAGIQADLKTFSALGCYGMTVLTALPVQNTVGVQSVYLIETRCIAEQCDAIFDDIGVDGIKIGMLFNEEVINVVYDAIKKSQFVNKIPIVVDPVMYAKSGDALLKREAVHALKERLLSISTIVTPNLMEAEELAGIKINDEDDMLKAGRLILDLGTKSVLVKGGHLKGDFCKDLLMLSHDVYFWYEEKKVKTKNLHGTGCTLSSAILAYCVNGLSITESVLEAKNYISKAIHNGSLYEIGQGHGPVHHFHKFW